jgi:hypothetical protein
MKTALKLASCAALLAAVACANSSAPLSASSFAELSVVQANASHEQKLDDLTRICADGYQLACIDLDELNRQDIERYGW